MKNNISIDIVIDKNCKEPKVTIHTSTKSKEIDSIVEAIKNVEEYKNLNVLAYINGKIELVAKNDMVHNDLARQISEKSVVRKYICLVHGIIFYVCATIDAPIGRDENNRKKMCVTDNNSKDAITHVRVLERYSDSTLIECVLETGRTHQIRVHMSYINHPVVNDPVYGFNKLDDKEFGQMLHAKEIGFVHPITHEFMDFTVEVPKRFKEILELYKNK